MKTLTRVLFGLLATPACSFADEPAPVRPAQRIQDNSFLVEEAYNQEPGIVQHILTADWRVDNLPGSNDRDLTFAFTQEWPFLSQRHQLSYTVPYVFARRDGNSVNGLGDVGLNYRYQALMESDTLPAFAPRVSLILPTGDEDKGLSNDRLGYQINLPLSRVISDRWTLHANAGLTFFPDVGDRNPLSFNLGGSAIYAVTDHWNLMLETVGQWNEEASDGQIEREFIGILSPGMRYGFDIGEAQLVVGVAAPIGLNGDAPDYGVLVYFSFEHAFQK